MDERELLNLVADERRAAVGFDNDQELSDDRERALEYARGVMKDVPALPNRSKATSTDVNDAVLTVLPDLMEMFTGGDDIATFQPKGAEDEEAAEQETDFVNHILMDKNDGFKHLYAAMQDALLIKTGVFKVWWEDSEEREEETFEGITPVQLGMLQQDGWTILDVQEAPDPMTGEPLLIVKAEKLEESGCLEWCAWPGEDFAVARDTVDIKGATYVAARSRPRAQNLIADGYDEDKVNALTTYSAIGDDSVQTARNTVDENAETSNSPLRQVEIIEHYVRLKTKDGETIHRIVTGNAEQVLLDSEEVEEIPFAAICPYPVAHRFYGRSLADLMIDIQRIKTALLRMFLDSGYFALNQRYSVNTTTAHDFTISDLLRNEPGVPVRTKGDGTVQAIQAGGLNFPALEALEYASTMGEMRSGVVRNAQGLNADALHDTAKGMQVLVSAAQKRVRMIGRIFAETGIRDLFLMAHAMLRRHSTRGQTVRLRGGWVDVDPSQWGLRDDMSVEIGIGSGGREQEMVALNQGALMMEKLIEMQGGTDGPFVTKANLYAFEKKYFERGLGFKSADAFITDPAKAAQQPQPPPPPDPDMVKVQQDGEIERQKMQMEDALARGQMAAEFQLKREQMQMEMRLKASQMAMQGSMNANMSGGDVRFGGEVG